MPIYEFHSPDTGKIYSFFAPTIKYSDLVPLCPEGPGKKMVRLISGFSITGKQKEATQPEAQHDQDPDDPFAGMDGDHANEIMKELESSISGMDEDNPDPRQMGSLMRKMCELSGETMDEPMEEVVRKLEEGMNPEDLEDRMGEFMGDGDIDQARSKDETHESTQSKLRKLLLARPIRDPQLYDFRDFIAE